MTEYFDTQFIHYANGGVIHVVIHLVDGKPHSTYYFPADRYYKPKPGMEGDVAYKLYNGRERSLNDVWREVLPMLEPM